MSNRSSLTLALGGWLLGTTVVAVGCLAQASRPDHELGRRFYEQGIGVDGEPVVAVIEAPSPGMPGVELSATALPCGSCHGADGRGRAEGGVEPTDLRPSSLTRSRQAVTPSGRRHPPYDARRLIRAVTLGFDPAGNRLETGMPRYRLSQRDAEALVAFWKTLDVTPSPGADDQKIDIGVLLPPSPAPQDQARLGVLRAWRDQISTAGGIYGRKIELRETTRPESTNPATAWVVLARDTSHLDASDIPALWLGDDSRRCSDASERPCFTITLPKRPSLSRRWQSLAMTYSLPREHVAAQLQALAATEILTSALEQAGRRLDTESLVRALRDRHGFFTSIGRIRLASSHSPNTNQP